MAELSNVLDQPATGEAPVQSHMQSDEAKLTNLRAGIAELDELLKQETGQVEFKQHMAKLQQSLRAASHLTQSLMPEEIGAMVAAIRRSAAEDLLSKRAKKPRAKKEPKLNMAEVNAMSAEDLFGDS